jgi:SAM-dependent methyltransferase
VSVELKNCPLCECKNHRELFLARDRHYGIPGSFRMVRCVHCSLIFLNPMYSDAELSAFYPDDYYAYQDNFRRNHWKDIVKRLLFCRVQTRDPEFAEPGRMLDLGCGSGWFMCAMRDRGWKTHGVEINGSAAEIGRRACGLEIFEGTLKQARFPAGYFDYVRSNHSFEHISCPGETLDEIHRILRPKGKILIGVPNSDSINAKLFGQYWWYLGAPVHPFTYSVNTLSQMLKKHNFQVERTAYNSDYSGILGSSQIWLNRKNGRKSTEGSVFNNPLLKVPCHWTAKAADLFRSGDAIEITAAKARV